MATRPEQEADQILLKLASARKNSSRAIWLAVCEALDPFFSGGAGGDHNNLTGLQGGNSSTEFYHLTEAEHGVVQNTSGVNTGDQDLSGLVPSSRTVNGQALSGNVVVTDSNLTTTDITDNNVSTAKHGFVPKAPNNVTNFLRGDGTWGVPTFENGVLENVYDVDFATLASQNFTANGAVTIDSRTWNVANRSNVETMSVVNGQGLYIKSSTTTTLLYGTTDSVGKFWIPLSDIDSRLSPPNWRELRIWTNLNFAGYSPARNYEQCGGMILCNNGSSPASGGNSSAIRVVSGWLGAPGICSGFPTATFNGSDTASVNYTLGSSHDCGCIRLLDSGTFEVYSGASVGGNFPASLANMTLKTSGLWLERAGITATLRLCYAFYIVNSNTYADMRAYMRRLKVDRIAKF